MKLKIDDLFFAQTALDQVGRKTALEQVGRGTALDQVGGEDRPRSGWWGRQPLLRLVGKTALVQVGG